MVTLVAVLAYTIDFFILPNLGLDSNLKSLTFLMFMSWASYFIVGGKIKNTFSHLGTQIIGAIVAVIMLTLGQKLEMMIGGEIGRFFGPAIGLLIFNSTLIYFEKIKKLNYVSIIFIGASAFYALYGLSGMGLEDQLHFGFTLKGNFHLLGVNILYMSLGTLLGFISVNLRGIVDKHVNKIPYDGLQ